MSFFIFTLTLMTSAAYVSNNPISPSTGQSPGESHLQARFEGESVSIYVSRERIEELTNTDKFHLNRTRSGSKNLVLGSFGVSIEVNQATRKKKRIVG
jgi:hypothetical protein